MSAPIRQCVALGFCTAYATNRTEASFACSKYIYYSSRVMRKPDFRICENKDADQLRGNREADQRLFFAKWIVQSLYFLNPEFQASSHLVWSYSLVCVGPGRKPRRPVFSQRGSFYLGSELIRLHGSADMSASLLFA